MQKLMKEKKTIPQTHFVRGVYRALFRSGERPLFIKASQHLLNHRVPWRWCIYIARRQIYVWDILQGVKKGCSVRRFFSLSSLFFVRSPLVPVRYKILLRLYVGRACTCLTFDPFTSLPVRGSESYERRYIIFLAAFFSPVALSLPFPSRVRCYLQVFSCFFILFFSNVFSRFFMTTRAAKSGVARIRCGNTVAATGGRRDTTAPSVFSEGSIFLTREI